MTTSRSQGEIGIERRCQLAGISRSGYYRHWQRSAPRQEETGLRDAIQCLALKHRHYGYRRIGALLRREGWQANHKRVLRLLREDNLLCLRNLNIEAKSADAFIADTIALDEGRAVAAIRRMRERFNKPAMTAADLLLLMDAAGPLETVDLLKPHVESL